jgi:hypothetical protein
MDQMTTTLSPAERAIWEARLVEAEKAYHELQIGGGVKTLVDQNGERIEFNTGSILRLSGYIAMIRNLLGIGAALGPMRFLGR